MDTTIMKKFENNLRTLEAEISRHVRQQDRSEIHIERTAEEMEQLALASARDIAVRTLDHNAHLLREVRAALTRIEEGTYGECLECEMKISERRLNAVPWARHCLACQERLDHSAHGFHRVLSHAA